MNLLMDVSTERQKWCRQEIQRDGARDKLVPKHTALETHYAESTFNSSCESPCSEPDPQLRDLLSETLLNWFRDVTNPKPGNVECATKVVWVFVGNLGDFIPTTINGALRLLAAIQIPLLQCFTSK
jgi:hypothetical protein